MPQELSDEAIDEQLGIEPLPSVEGIGEQLMGGLAIPSRAGQAGAVADAKEKKNKKPRLKRRGRCQACKNLDCGACRCCRDKVKFGGTGLKKQACLARRCTAMCTRLPPNEAAEIASAFADLLWGACNSP